MPKGILLFDLDGTLVDSAGGVASALSMLRAERGAGPIDPDQVRPWISLGADQLIARALGGWAREPAADLARFRVLLSSVPTDPDCVYPGVRVALQTLASAGFAMAVVTNKPEQLSRNLLADLGLDRQFAAVVGGDTALRPKPDPAPIRHALAVLGGQPARAILIGDSAIDAAAARGAGLPFFLFEGGYGASECAADSTAARFATFASLPALVGPWWRRSPDRTAAVDEGRQPA